ncbi:flippase [Seongchinamella unica]|uniref:Flippase n=1 Tax=Seongchinamella unica TaxID=2547392 RepID=A0A4R5LQA3_9GAMM|nr:flippase [Seongchinamella unica]TDG12754.1 flippase [Seongchinamella unica]
MKIVPRFLQRRMSHRPDLLKIVDNVSWLFFDRFLRMGIGLLVGVWIARYLGPEKFGLLNFVMAFVGLFGAIAVLGLQEIIVRDLVRDPSHKEQTLGTAALLLLFSGFLAYGLAMVVIFWLRPEDQLARILVAIFGSTLLLRCSDVAKYWFESQVLSKYTVWVQNVFFVIFAAIKVGLILAQAPLVAFVWAMVTEAALVAATMLAVLDLSGTRLMKMTMSARRAKTLLADSWPLLLSGIAVMIYMQIDQIMLAQMVGENAVGIYSAAVRISEVWYFLPLAIVASVFPNILQAREKGEKEYYSKLQHLYDLMAWLSITVALPMTFLSTFVATLLFGAPYAAAGPVLAVHVWTSFFVFLGVASSRWFVAEGQQLLLLQKTVLGAAVNVILNLILIPQYGAIGAAWTTVFSYSVSDLFADLIHRETRAMFLMKIKVLNPGRLFGW